MEFQIPVSLFEKSGYLYQMDIYLGRKQTLEFNIGLGDEVVLQLTKELE